MWLVRSDKKDAADFAVQKIKYYNFMLKQG